MVQDKIKKKAYRWRCSVESMGGPWSYGRALNGAWRKRSLSLHMICEIEKKEREREGGGGGQEKVRDADFGLTSVFGLKLKDSFR